MSQKGVLDGHVKSIPLKAVMWFRDRVGEYRRDHCILTIRLLSRDQVLMSTSHLTIFESSGGTSPVVGYTQRWHVLKSIMGVNPSRILSKCLALAFASRIIESHSCFGRQPTGNYLIAPVQDFVAFMQYEVLTAVNSLQFLIIGLPDYSIAYS